jgi:hypothetical protein
MTTKIKDRTFAFAIADTIVIDALCYAFKIGEYEE